MPPKRRLGKQGWVGKEGFLSTASVKDASDNPPSDLPKTKPPFSAGLALIDTRDSDARKQVRSHVMKEFMRHKRWEQNEPVDPRTRNYIKDSLVLRPQTPGHDSPPAVLGILTLVDQDSSEDESSTRLNAVQRTEKEDDSSIRHGAARRIQEKDDALNENASRMLTVRNPNPVSSFSSFRSGPLSSLPIKILEKDRALVDHYSYVYPDLMFGFQQPYNPVQTICLTRALQGPIAFQATVMVIGAAHLSVLREFRGLDMDSRSIQQKVRALRMLNDGIGRITEETCMDILFGILSLASAEDRFGNPETSWLHLQGAIRTMEKFRDSLMIRDHHDLTMYCNWINLTSTGYDEYGLREVFHDSSVSGKQTDFTSPLPSFPTSDPFSPPFSSPPPSASGALTAVDEFISFLRNVEHLALSHGSPSYPCAAFPQRHNAFLPSSILYRLLTVVHKKREIVHTPRIQRACRLASLIYLNAALWDFRTSYSDTDHFLSQTEAKVIEQELHVSLSSEAFALTLFHGFDNPNFNREGRIWFTARMVNVAKRLNRESWNKINKLLLGFLMMRHGEGERFLVWEGELRRELVMAPLSSHELAPAFRWVGSREGC